MDWYFVHGASHNIKKKNKLIVSNCYDSKQFTNLICNSCKLFLLPLLSKSLCKVALNYYYFLEQGQSKENPLFRWNVLEKCVDFTVVRFWH